MDIEAFLSFCSLYERLFPAKSAKRDTLLAPFAKSKIHDSKP